MIVIPELNPQLLKTFETDFGTSIAQILWRRIMDHLNWLNVAIPVGSIQFFYAAQTYANGSPIASPGSNWQFCNGDPITDVNSPLVGQNTPDLRGKFLRGSDTPASLGGSDTINLVHDHGGGTGGTFDGESVGNTSSDSEQGGPSFHNHPIFATLGVVTRLPPYAELQPYMRIV